MAELLSYVPCGYNKSLENKDLNNLTEGGLWVVTATINAPIADYMYWLVDVRVNKQGDVLQLAKVYAGGDSVVYSRILRSEVDLTWTGWR